MGRSGSGVEVRDSSIRIKFILNEETIRERVTVNGKSLEPTPPNIKYAERLAAEIKRRIELGNFSFADFFPDSVRATHESHEATTFGKLADLWLESCGRLSDASRDQYGTAVRLWKRVFGENTLIRDITHKMLAGKIGAYPWSTAKTHNNYLIALRGIFDLEYPGPATINNPMNGIENMKVVRTLPDPMSISERDAILVDMKAQYDERVHAYFQWMFYTGMRPEEAIALRWSDIDWNRMTVRIQRVRTFKGSERDGSKTHAEREVDLLPQVVDALLTMKPYTFMQKIEREGDTDTAADIFQNPITGKAWHDERAQRDTYWRPTLKRLGIRWRTAYNTRHTFATVALMAAVPPAYIANQLGHSVKMLLEKYARWIPENDDGSARAMLAAAMANSQTEIQNSSQIRPKKRMGQPKWPPHKDIFGRRDWTRTNDPHHVNGVNPKTPYVTY